nr:YdbH domain-containing protein [Hephaestia sp. MAHUQ-44]
MRWWLIGGSALVLVPLVGLWTQRKPIAASYVDAFLAAKGVTARYHIADLGLGRQRLTNLVIGDPAHPDLVADWVELSTGIGLSGASVTAVRAGHVRLRGRLVDGALSLGTIDKLLPAPSGAPFALPALDITVADAGMRLETPYGVIGLHASGSGRLDDGFSGRVAAVAETLDLSGCTAGRAAALLRVSIADARPTLAGPVSAGSVVCGDTRAGGAHADIAVTLGERLDRWQGRAGVKLADLRAPIGHLRALAGSLDFNGSPTRTSGTLNLASGAVTADRGGAARLALAGGYRIENGFVAFQGSAGARSAQLADAGRAAIVRAGASAEGSPVGPLVARLARAGAAAAGDFNVTANIDALHARGQGRVGVSRLIVSAASGASATLAGGDGIQYGWPDAGLRVDGLLTLSGGGMPEAAIQLHQTQARAPMTGNALIQRYAADGASLALTPVTFTAHADGSTRFSTNATLSGPLGDGRIEKASLPISGVWNGAGRLSINPRCAPLAFDRLAVSSLVLMPTRLTLCPVGGALVAVDGGSVTGGARVAASHLQGRLGQTPLSLDASGAELALGTRGFVLRDVAAVLGAEGSQTRIEATRLDGRLAGSAVAGTFAGARGQIGNVPLLLSEGAGDWRFAAGKLALAGGLTVADAAEAPRFNPLVTHDVAFDLVANRITATGTLAEPETGTKVADVTIAHDLSSGAGSADLTVPGITFGKGFQPNLLTRLTYGVIADVAGTVRGQGHIAWTPEGVTSTGTFGTDATDLAAAFGPVEGLATEIHFTDLLGMVTAPGQRATIASVNPGVAATGGVIRYRLHGPTQVEIEGGRWPFAGGELVLEPTLLDFAEHRKRHLTFTITGMDAAQFLQQFDFKNLSASGVFDGTMPMVFDESGGRIEGGHLAVRAGGGALAYVGPVSQENLGTWGDMAFQALKALDYKSLTITMNGPLAGEMVTEVHFAGVNQGQGTKSNFLIRRLSRLPLVFNVTIRAPFRGLIDSARGLYDPTRLVERNLPQLIERQNEAGAAPSTTPAEHPIQPTESETVP